MEENDIIKEGEERDSFELIQINAKGKTLTKFDIWERKLLDFSLRNTLLNMSPRRRALQLITFDANRVEDSLQAGTEYRISPTPDEDTQTGAPRHLLSSREQEHLREQIEADMEKKTLHTFLPEEDTKAALKKIYRTAKSALEESGANTLFLAVGTLRWYVTDKSTTPRYAPILLLPLEMVYKKGAYSIRSRDEEPTVNITLLEFLSQNFGITVNGLDPLPKDENGLDVPLILNSIREAVKEQARWDVEEECVAGIFSFSKFLLWNDMRTHRDQLTENSIVTSLLSNRLTWIPEPMATDLRLLDSSMQPTETALPVPADSSQMAAVIAGGEGRSFILYGPPGTGKSQTITNLIANALYHGKRVLFVAEKMAALSVVQKRLEQLGLDPFCLELHSKKATKRHVLEQLGKSLNTKRDLSPSHYSEYGERILKRRKELNDYISALHTPDSSDGLSVYDCIIRAESIETSPMKGFSYDPAIDAFLNREGIHGVEETLGSRLMSVVNLTGQPSLHPLQGFRPDRSMLAETDRIAKEMEEDARALGEYLKEGTNLKGTKPLRDKLLRDNTPEILAEDPEELRNQWRQAKSKWALPRYFAKKALLKRLRQYNPYLSEEETPQLIDDLILYRDLHTKLAAMNHALSRWGGVETDSDEMPARSVIETAKEKLERWGMNATKMREWLHWCELSDELKRDGMGSVAEALESEETEPEGIKDAFLKALFIHKGERKAMASDVLAIFAGVIHDEKSALYRRLTKEFQRLTRQELYSRLSARIPAAIEQAYAAKGTELALLNRNISNGGRGVSLRDLFDQLPTLLPRLCPVMLMSPMSVAQYIGLTAEKFDLVIFDEASQLPTSEAVGAIARGKSLIVVGDPKQMPPTSFFSANAVDEEETEIDDMESILEDCKTLDMPSLQLSWHYRSRHESLIAFSNHEYYNGELITFPSTDDKRKRVHFIKVEGGVYEKGGRRCNRKEAEAIAGEIARRLRHKILRKQSIGVIAFSVAQQTLIEDVWQERLEHDRGLSEIVAELPETIFIKNLENVQGDERDVILFSIGYGPDKEGKVSMNFGPLNNAGGERRLNVAVSRARREMYVFSSLNSGDIDLRRTNAKGVEGLKHFLEYAESLRLPQEKSAVAGEKASVIAEEIASQLRKEGYECQTNVGRSNFRVDVAVEDKDRPGTYALAILLDGKTYRDTPTATDREVVQPDALRELGWKVTRVWSLDWMRDRKRVLGSVLSQLER